MQSRKIDKRNIDIVSSKLKEVADSGQNPSEKNSAVSTPNNSPVKLAHSVMFKEAFKAGEQPKSGHSQAKKQLTFSQ